MPALGYCEPANGATFIFQYEAGFCVPQVMYRQVIFEARLAGLGAVLGAKGGSTVIGQAFQIDTVVEGVE